MKLDYQDCVMILTPFTLFGCRLVYKWQKVRKLHALVRSIEKPGNEKLGWTSRLCEQAAGALIRTWELAWALLSRVDIKVWTGLAVTLCITIVGLIPVAVQHKFH